jgi:rubredoxin
MEAVRDVSLITCPACGFAKEEVMPATSCEITYRCTKCGAELRPADGDCCVYCTYGSVPCQAVQVERARGVATD